LIWVNRRRLSQAAYLFPGSVTRTSLAAAKIQRRGGAMLTTDLSEYDSSNSKVLDGTDSEYCRRPTRSESRRSRSRAVASIARHLESASVISRDAGRTNRPHRLIWIDKAGLSLAAAVLLMFLMIWLLLIVAAGSAPTGRLSALCAEWMIKTVVEAIIPAWLILRGIRAIAPHLGFKSR
jgi:hypothetical protein